MNKLKIGTICSGIGFPEMALKALGLDYEVEYYCEIDRPAAASYMAIHGEPHSKNLIDLTKIDTAMLPRDLDLIIGGTPCQDFSGAGLRKGGEQDSGTRSSLMWYFLKIVKDTAPKVILWENVLGCLSGKMRTTYDKFVMALTSLGYTVHADILNAKDFGVPQNRDRVFVLAIRKDLHLPFFMPRGYYCGTMLKDVLEDNVDESYYLSDEQVEKLLNSKFVHNKNSIIDEGGVCRTITAHESKMQTCVKQSVVADAEAMTKNTAGT